MLQKLLTLHHASERRRWLSTLGHLEATQRQQFSTLLKTLDLRKARPDWLSDITSYEQVSPSREPTEYASLEPGLESQRLHLRPEFWHGPISKWVPTSGSTNRRKWIPYTSEFLADINRAAGAWLGDLNSQFPSLRSGRHYWSLSWLPEELRRVSSNDDTKLFPWWQRAIWHRVMAMPNDLERAPSAAAAWFGQLVFLAATSDLTLISVWSPTHLLEMIRSLWTHYDEISTCLRTGAWSNPELAYLTSPRRSLPAKPTGDYDPTRADIATWLQELWPKLSVVSCWDSANSKQWASQVERLFPRASLQGKGLWATEGVVSIPFGGHSLLAFRSHFFEFRCLHTDRILPAWKLQPEQVVQPLLWTRNGFSRYPLHDRLRVTGFEGSVPRLEFLGRLHSIDLVGEKISTVMAEEIIGRAQHQWGVSALTLVADRATRGYKLIVNQTSLPPGMDQWLETMLGQNHHYQVAREMHQLIPAAVTTVAHTEDAWAKLHRSPIRGQNKPEVLMAVENLSL